ncbi:MAG: SH3 domain-containing protein, partial [Krumholzibacteria bacterium]|nr:SH3 domain-containing protein [Candidatus Krumholzibacteria bacterium]
LGQDVGGVQGRAPADAAGPTLNAPYVLTEKSVRLGDAGVNVVRTGPGHTFAIVGVYAGGSRFPVIAKKDEWYNVRLSDSETGWIHASLCEEFDDMSGLEFRPNPRLFSRVGAYAVTLYAGGYAFDRKSNSLVLGGRAEYYLMEMIGIGAGVGWTHVDRPAEIVESLFGLTLEQEEFHMLFYAFNANVKLLPGRQMVPYLTVGAGNSIMEGATEGTLNYGAGLDFFVKRTTAVTFEFRRHAMSSGTADARRDNANYEFSVGSTFLF